MPANIFEDGFGTRRLVSDAETGEALEVLSISPALVEANAFAAAVGERVARLAPARHASYARVRRLERPSSGALDLLCDRVPGWRLSDILRAAAADGIRLDISAAVNLLRQLVPAVALFSRHQRDLAIGCIAPERLILTPQARLIIAEYALGAGVARLQFSRERLWRDLRVVVPTGEGNGPRVTPRADVMGIGIVALSLVLGRPLAAEEFPSRIEELIASATESSGGLVAPLSAGLKVWIARTLQLDPRTALATPQEAQVAFEEVLAGERGYVTTPALLEQFVARMGTSLGPPPAGDAPPGPSPAPTAPARQPKTTGPTPPDEKAGPAAPVRVRVPAGRGLLAAMASLIPLQALVIVWLWTRDASPLEGDGELVIESRPPGARVIVDREERGVTPLTLRLEPGTHVLELRAGNAEPRVIPLTIRAGVQTAQYIELASVAATGALRIQSQPSRARVRVNGQPRGTTPLNIGELPPGEYEVVVDLEGREARQRVRVEPGGTTQVNVPIRR